MAVASASGVIVRPFAPADQEAVLAIWKDGFRDTFQEEAQVVSLKPRRLLMVAAAVGGSALLAAVNVIGAPLAVAASVASVCGWRAAVPLRVRKNMKDLVGQWPDMDNIQKHWAEDPKRVFLVAEMGGEVVGCTALTLELPPPPPEEAQPKGEGEGASSTKDGKSEAGGKDGESKDKDTFKQPALEPHACLLGRLSTSRKHRRCGIGRKLVQEAERVAKAKGKTLIRLYTAHSPAVAFYQRNGYKLVYYGPSPIALALRVLEKEI